MRTLEILGSMMTGLGGGQEGVWRKSEGREAPEKQEGEAGSHGPVNPASQLVTEAQGQGGPKQSRKSSRRRQDLRGRPRENQRKANTSG